jgi:hypothetical protein
MDLPPGPPSLGESAPPSAPERDADRDGERAEPDADAYAERDRLLADEAANRRLVATTAALALIAVAIMIGVFLLTQDSSSDEALPEAPPATAVSTPTPVEPAPEIDRAELDQVIVRVRDFVATERGLEFEEDVQVLVLGRQEYQDEVRASFDARVDQVRAYLTRHASVYQALGLWPVGSDPVALTRELDAVGSTGFYDVVTGRVVMGITELSPLFEMRLAHELTQALDDQHFDLDRPQLYQRNDEAAVAFEALVQGDARRVELAYQATLSAADRDSIDADAATATPEFDPQAVPPMLLYEQQVTDDDGQVFVQGLVDDGGNAAVDRAFRHPPTTTEDIEEPAAAVDVPVADAEVIGEGVIGQATLDVITTFSRPESEVVPEWNGDRYVLWADEDEGSFCVRFRVVGDTAGFEEQLQSWATEVGADVAVVDGAVVATSCR